MSNLGIVMATYNEVANLSRVVEALEGLPLAASSTIYVVDDSSPDGTGRRAEELAQRYHNVVLLTRPRRLGLGSALRDGMEMALRDGCRFVLTMDSDLSHSPEDVPGILAAVEDGEVHLVQGSRYMEGGGSAGVSWWRRGQSWAANMLLWLLSGPPREKTTGFKLYSQKAARLVVARGASKGYEFQAESVLLAKRHGLRVVEVPIIFHARAAGRSKLSPLRGARYILALLRTVAAYRLGRGAFSR